MAKPIIVINQELCRYVQGIAIAASGKADISHG